MGVFKILLIMAIFTLVANCSYRHEKTDQTQGIQEIEIPINVSYQMVNEKIFAPSCIPCHGSAGNVNLETYPSVFGNIARIRDVALVSKRMPRAPFPPLTNTQLALLSAWIQSGAPENPPAEGVISDMKKEVLLARFKSIKKNIFDHKCLICHSVGKSAEKVSLDNPQNLINSHSKLVIPGDPDGSALIHSVMPDAERMMPPAESSIENLDHEEIEIIKKWIENGAKD